MSFRKSLRGLITMKAALIAAMAIAGEPGHRPNFLIILADDVSPEQFGCYGNTETKTPNVDALARAGVQFNTAWATPMCSSTRALLVTGRYASTTGVWHNDLRITNGKHGRWDWAKAHLTFAQVLRANGYRTALAGNIMALGSDIRSDDVGFDEHCFHALTLRDVPEGSTFDGLFEGKYNFPDAKPVPSRYWHPCVIQNGELMDTGPDDFGPDLYSDFLIDFMSRHRDQPFLAYYPMKLIHGIAGTGLPTTPVRGRPGTNTGGNLKDLNEYVDVMVGKLVKALDELDLRDSTIIIFASDNGDSHGCKMHATEDGPRVPFIVSCPDIIKQRGATSELMDFSDVFPTLVEFSKSCLPDGYTVDGKSMVPFLTGESDTHREWIVSYIATARLARTRDWLLEASDPVYGTAMGRLYYTGDAHLRKDYRPVDSSKAGPIREMFDEILKNLPWPDKSDPSIAREIQRYDNMPYKHFLDKGKLVKKISPSK